MSNKMTTSIMKKWNDQGSFIRFLDGNPTNVALTNLECVSIEEAMKHVDDWKVDWDMNLTDKEIALVRTSKWRDGLYFGTKR